MLPKNAELLWRERPLRKITFPFEAYVAPLDRWGFPPERCVRVFDYRFTVLLECYYKQYFALSAKEIAFLVALCEARFSEDGDA